MMIDLPDVADPVTALMGCGSRGKDVSKRGSRLSNFDRNRNFSIVTSPARASSLALRTKTFASPSRSATSGMIIVGFAIYDLRVLTTRKDKSGGMS